MYTYPPLEPWQNHDAASVAIAESPDITGRFHKEVAPPPPLPPIDWTSADMWKVSGAKNKDQARAKSQRLKKLHEDMVS